MPHPTKAIRKFLILFSCFFRKKLYNILNSLQTPPIKICRNKLKWQNPQRRERVHPPPPLLQANTTTAHSVTHQHHPLLLFLVSSNDQHQMYYSLFSNRVILNPKYLDVEFFNEETLDCYQVFQNSELVEFMTLKLSYYPELVRVFYNNLKI